MAETARWACLAYLYDLVGVLGLECSNLRGGRIAERRSEHAQVDIGDPIL